MASLPESLFESEMFGHVKGAFTGARTNKIGLIEAAHGGHLFLDEIEALSLTNQAKLLRFLENGEIRKVGGKDILKVQTRVIAANNKSLQQMVGNLNYSQMCLQTSQPTNSTSPTARTQRRYSRTFRIFS